MSLSIIRAGILDTVQDQGRLGYQHVGINPNGAMDTYSSQLANALLGKELKAPVLELHFPASHILFQKEAMICITGGDFTPAVDGHPIPMNHPVILSKNSLLQFQHHRYGARCYISFLPELKIDSWMGSYSTNINCNAGGFGGRALHKGDKIAFNNNIQLSGILKYHKFSVLHWTAGTTVKPVNEIDFIIGSEWYWLSREGQEIFKEQYFQITNEADRMGYRLASKEMVTTQEEQLVSSAVTFGTVQLLPNGQLIILMADHQTTGGYPRLAHVISAHLPILAQKGPNDVVHFNLTDLAGAEHKMIEQQKYLRQVQVACKFRMENVLHGIS